MINSIINPSITYNETLKIANEDLDYNTSVYETEILGKNVELVLGKEKEKDNISYFSFVIFGYFC